ncbi:hypothetical protein TNCV_3577951 [Trichonephila clavipes]|uniref:Uncharacterized protein n=1 Tax=Trichonephila clavipes TaxID=2585209 RepID=A0A8X6RK65_TRICX|nr:hypothetical protein TNCV_3577951 [Trichonephila clavipes]
MPSILRRAILMSSASQYPGFNVECSQREVPDWTPGLKVSLSKMGVDCLEILLVDTVLCHKTATAGSDVVQSGRPIFDDFFQHLWQYIGNNMANVVLQMIKRL